LYDLVAMTTSGGTTTNYDVTDTDHDDSIDLLLVGADCICQDAIVNKVGTKRLAALTLIVVAVVATSCVVPIASNCGTVRFLYPWKICSSVFP
jgi:translation initiation factor 2B subunit (eIF-2B alpha/beta/delta family)